MTAAYLIKTISFNSKTSLVIPIFISQLLAKLTNLIEIQLSISLQVFMRIGLFIMCSQQLIISNNLRVRLLGLTDNLRDARAHVFKQCY